MRRAVFAAVIFFVFLTAGISNPDEILNRKQKIADNLADIESYGGDLLGYSKEMLKYLREAENIAPRNKVENRRINKPGSRRERRGDIDYYSLLSGGLAIRESLQLESIRQSRESGGAVKISELRGPEIKSHPFQEMLKGKKFKLSALAVNCPEDFYYFHFNNMLGALDFFDYLGEVGGSIHKRLSPKSVDYMLKEKILTQLAVRENRAARKFYKHIIEEMAITGSDPFINEGSDVSLLFKIRGSAIFLSKITEYRNYFKKIYKAEEKGVDISGISGKHLFTPDRRINSFFFTLPDGTFVISNSAAASETIIKTYRKKRKSMADADDYKYMRSIYPADPMLEDGFLYLSDSFIRRLVGPELRIKEARRMYEDARMALLERYIIYYYQLRERLPLSLDGIFQALKVPGGRKGDVKISSSDYYKGIFSGLDIVNGSFSAASKIHGRKGFMKPNLESVLDSVTEAEASEYKRFLNEYNNFWRDFFDPIGIRFRFDKGIKADTCILPLINNSLYNQLTAVIGGAPAPLNAGTNVPGDVFSLSFKLNENFFKKMRFDEILRSYMQPDPLLKDVSLFNIIKGEVRFHMNDVRPLMDFDGKEIFNEMMRDGINKPDIFFGLLIWSMSHPVRIDIPVKDVKAANSVIQSMDRFRVNQNDRWMEIKTYSIENEKIDPGIKVIKITFFNMITFRVYITIKNDVIHIAGTEHYMKSIIDSPVMKKGDEPAHIGNIIALFRPDQMVLERNMFKANIMESAQVSSFENFGMIKLLHTLFKDSKNLAGLSLENFGFKPLCPMGGDYVIDNDGMVTNSVFGSPSRPVIREGRINSDIFKRYFSTEKILLELMFTDEGIMTTVQTE